MMLADLMEPRPIQPITKKEAVMQTFGDILRKYSNEVSASKITKNWEQTRIASILLQPLANIPVSMLSAPHIVQWRDSRLKTVSAATVRREWALLSNVCKVAVTEWKLMSAHPMEEVRQPKAPDARDRRIDEGEEKMILENLGYSRFKAPVISAARAGAAFLFAIETAMRMAEIVRLSWGDVDLEKRVATLRQTKNGSKRYVPLSTEAIRLINQFKPTGSGGRIFGLTNASLDNHFRRARDKAEIVDLHFHDTRHEAITRLAKKLNVLDLARMTGHKDIKQLMVYYNATAEELAKQLD